MLVFLKDQQHSFQIHNQEAQQAKMDRIRETVIAFIKAKTYLVHPPIAPITIAYLV